MRFLHLLERFFDERAPVAPRDLVLVAFSGGADSTALLWGLARLAAARGLRLHAAHLDHGEDPDSARRATAAARICAALGVPSTCRREPVPALRRPGESAEAAARRVRYGFLEGLRRELGAAYLATGHQRDDQVETVLLRLSRGSGLAGLAGIPARRGALVRPLLAAGRAELAAVVHAAGLEPVRDPSNRDLRRPRNRLRLLVLPRLRAEDPDIDRRVLALAEAARTAVGTLDRLLARRLRVRARAGGASLDRAELEHLPTPLTSFALALLHRRAGAPYPPSRKAAAELLRQLRRGGEAGCDCGGSWRWRSRGGRLELRPRARGAAPFAYTLTVPGEIELPELAVRVCLRRAAVAPWMFEGSPVRAALALPIAPGDRITVRSRRPGDRIRPFGCAYSRRLKEVLIDRRMPREERDRLPLVCLDGRIAWVPGVTIDDSFRLGDETSTWVAEIRPA